jgi:ABC-type transport system substrate-binding protein
MRHRTTITAGALTAALAVSVLTGCSSSDKKSDDAKSTTPASSSAATDAGATPSSSAVGTKDPAKAAKGHLDYSGDSIGSADFTGGVACEIKGGKLIGVTSPDVNAKKKIFPSFIATTDASPTQVALFNNAEGKSYSGRVSKSEGVSGHKSGSDWTVTVQGLRIAQDFGGTGGVVTLTGSFTCTHLT